MGVNEQIQYVRENFEKKYADNIALGMYDARDLDRLRRDSVFVRTFIRGKDRLDEGVDLVHLSFKFRKEVNVNDLCEESFDKELFELGGMYFHKKDVSGQRIMWLRVKLHRKDASAERLATEKQGLVFAMEKAFNENPLSPIVVLLDMTSCGLANLDIDFVKYIISCFKFYYPTFLAYMLIYDMPWIFNAAWKVIKAWLSPEAAAKIKFVTKADIQTYLKAEDLPPYMGGTDNFEFVFKPGMCSEPLYPEDDKKNDKKLTPPPSDKPIYESTVIWAEVEDTDAHYSVIGSLCEATVEARHPCDFIHRSMFIIGGTWPVTVFTLVLLALPLVMTAIGVNYLHECPREPKLPIYLVVGGCFGIIKLIFLLWKQIKRHRDDVIDLHDDDDLLTMTRMTNMALNVFLSVWFVFGHYWLIRIWKPHFKAPLHEPRNWCDETVFFFTFWQLVICHIIIGLVLVTAIILYCCYVCVKCFVHDDSSQAVGSQPRPLGEQQQQGTKR